MTTSSLPKSIALLECIATQCERIEQILTPKTPEHHALTQWVSTENSFCNTPNIAQSEVHIRYIQILLLTGLSMYGGILLSAIQHFNVHQDTIRIGWDSGINDEFTFGQYDHAFLKFYQYYQQRLFQPVIANYTHSSAINPSIFLGVAYYIQSYQIILAAIEKKLNLIITNQSKIATLLSDKGQPDLLFIVLSSLPTDQLNALFIYIKNFFPEDLTYKTPSGNMVNIIIFFQSPSTDMNYLFEKINVYLALYHDKNIPIIQEITHIKTAQFLTKLCQNKTLFESLQTNLKNLLNTQIKARQPLYDLFDHHINTILSATTYV